MWGGGDKSGIERNKTDLVCGLSTVFVITQCCHFEDKIPPGPIPSEMSLLLQISLLQDSPNDELVKFKYQLTSEVDCEMEMAEVSCYHGNEFWEID